MESLVGTVVDEVEADTVLAVRLEVGRLAGVDTDALRFCFDVCAAGTLLEGATLEIIDHPGRGRCRVCNAELSLEAVPFSCPCGSFDVSIVSGQELRIFDVEVR